MKIIEKAQNLALRAATCAMFGFRHFWWFVNLMVKARYCVDFMEVNKAICTEGHKYRMPTIQNMTEFAKDGEWFCTMDILNAFMHVELHENSRWLQNSMGTLHV